MAEGDELSIGGKVDDEFELALDELLVEAVELFLLLVFEELLLFALFEQAEAARASASAIIPSRFISLPQVESKFRAMQGSFRQVPYPGSGEKAL